MFLLGQTLHGIGATPLFSIGTAYLDENVSQKASPVYLGKKHLVQSSEYFKFNWKLLKVYSTILFKLQLSIQ